MKALSVKQPVGSLILEGVKTIETRVWKTNYRGDILICGSLNWFKGTLRFPERDMLQLEEDKKRMGKAICVVSLVNIHFMDWREEIDACCPVYEGAYSWVLENIRPVKPFPVKGKLSLFEVDDSLIEYL